MTHLPSGEAVPNNTLCSCSLCVYRRQRQARHWERCVFSEAEEDDDPIPPPLILDDADENDPRERELLVAAVKHYKTQHKHLVEHEMEMLRAHTQLLKKRVQLLKS